MPQDVTSALDAVYRSDWGIVAALKGVTPTFQAERIGRCKSRITMGCAGPPAHDATERHELNGQPALVFYHEEVSSCLLGPKLTQVMPVTPPRRGPTD